MFVDANTRSIVKASTWLCLSALYFYSAAVLAYQADAVNQDTLHIKKEIPLMIKFIDQQEIKYWGVTNDGVMGGKSTGEIAFKADHGVFSGRISLQNNGGFSSIYRVIKPLPQDLEVVSIEVAGDGQPYQMRLMANIEGYRVAYKHNFNTAAGVRQKISFKLTDFQASFRGRLISNAPKLNSADIGQVGFLITKKVPGDFSLSIYNLSFSQNE
ncbi:CIA30 family protein [Colwelliaceae bacterium 6441]